MSPNALQWQQEQHLLEVLSSLSYRTGELRPYLQEVAWGVKKLIGLDWSVVTLCQENSEQVLASTLDLEVGQEQMYSLHGTLTGYVVQQGCPLVVEDATITKDYGEPPEGYRAYLGIPLRTPTGEVIGTICSFQHYPRHFQPEEVQLVEIFAERAATAIDNYRLYQQQRKLNQVLAHLAEIGELAAMIVHEVRNPLTSVFMGLNSFKSLELPERFQKRLQFALEEADRLQKLLNEILLYAKQQSLNYTKIELNQWITDTLNSINSLPIIQDKIIIFTPTSTSINISGDQDKLKQVLVNLITNACEAVQGEAVISLTLDQDSHYLFLRIHNGGNPIPSEILPKLTKPFFTTKSSGNGLGLAIVKRIIEAHHGELLIESEATTGTTVTVKLPVSMDLIK